MMVRIDPTKKENIDAKGKKEEFNEATFLSIPKVRPSLEHCWEVWLLLVWALNAEKQKRKQDL